MTLVSQSVIEKHGLKKVLQLVVRDLNELATTRVTVSMNGIDFCYKGCLLAFLGDTLASRLKCFQG